MKDLIENVVPLMNIPSWATHIAIRDSKPKIQCAIYHDESKSFVDEDPSVKKEGDILGSFDERYWEFYPVAEIEGAVFKDADLSFDEALVIASKCTIVDKFANYLLVSKKGDSVCAARWQNEPTEFELKFCNSHFIKVK